MNEKLLEYMNIPNITAEEVKRLIEIDEEMRLLNDQINVLRRKGKDAVAKKNRMVRLRREHLYITEQLTNCHMSGIDKEAWKILGKKYGNKGRSKRVNILIKKDVGLLKK